MKYLVVGVLIFGASIGLLAQDESSSRDNTPKYSNEFMNIGVSARSFGMGFTAVSFIDDVTAGYWNPAGLNSLGSDHQLALMHSSYFGGLANYDYAAFATSVDEESKIAISVIRFAVDDIPDTRFLVDVNGSINYDNIQFFSSADYGFLVSYARKLPFLGGVDAGGNLKIIHRTVGSFSKAWGFGFDFGAQKEINDWKLGLVARDMLGTFNAWSHNTDEVEEVYALTGNDVPVNSVEVTLPRLILGGSREFTITEKFGVLTSVDLDMTFDGKRNTLIKSSLISIDPKAGVEFDYKKLAFLRLGINQIQQIKDFDGSKSWTFQPNFGVGVNIKELTVDYALTDIGDLAPGLFSHVFSIKVDFNVEE
ncbi:PorV/PorQ family protein [Ekhidna sp. To15]|uniref:putative type IX sorting system protein PorV2 n=1 Tax=Ekhidna sp. To15 TaxID=3395267 RepID=UPI003F527366